jgi:NADH:ubiquinone oxidoreductase subunit
MGETLGTWIYTKLFGQPVGEDQYGHRYYRAAARGFGRRERRWVIYKGEVEASAVPPEWQAWLTHTVASTPLEQPPAEQPWEKPHRPNLTGTAEAYRPAGSLLRDGAHAPAAADYEPWRPD